jgi:hypothetical protein
MATTKVRRKTPMKNRPALWRKMAEKTLTPAKEIMPNGFVVDVIRETRTGRQLRNAMNGMNHQGFLLPIHVWLFKSAGISTPVLDKALASAYTKNVDMGTEPIDGPVVDATIINEVGTHAA